MRRNGFTLLEVCVAIAISGVVVLLAHRVFAAAADGGRQLLAAREAADREHNGLRWLRAAFGSLDVADQAGGFSGRPNRVTFTAWVQQPGLWFEPSRITLGLYDDRFMATGVHGVAPLLANHVESVAFDYLLEPGATAHWAREWVSPVSAPLAIRVRLERATRTDTLLFVIGPRG